MATGDELGEELKAFAEEWESVEFPFGQQLEGQTGLTSTNAVMYVKEEIERLLRQIYLPLATRILTGTKKSLIRTTTPGIPAQLRMDGRELHQWTTANPDEREYDTVEAGRRILVWGAWADHPRKHRRSLGFKDKFIAWAQNFWCEDAGEEGAIIRTMNQPWEWVVDAFDELVPKSRVRKQRNRGRPSAAIQSKQTDARVFDRYAIAKQSMSRKEFANEQGMTFKDFVKLYAREKRRRERAEGSRSVVQRG